MELVDGVDVGEEEGHQAFGHGVFFDHSAAEPLGAGEGQHMMHIYIYYMDWFVNMIMDEINKSGVSTTNCCRYLHYKTKVIPQEPGFIFYFYLV